MLGLGNVVFLGSGAVMAAGLEVPSACACRQHMLKAPLSAHPPTPDPQQALHCTKHWSVNGLTKFEKYLPIMQSTAAVWKRKQGNSHKSSLPPHCAAVGCSKVLQLQWFASVTLIYAPFGRTGCHVLCSHAKHTMDELEATVCCVTSLYLNLL